MVNSEDPGAGAAPPPDAGWVSPVSTVLDRIAWVCRLIAGVLLVILVVIFGWLVFGRYVLNSTPTWVEQASLVLVVYITFLGAAVGIRQNTHLSIDFIREAMPPGPRNALRYISDAAIVVFGVFMTWQGWGLIETNLHRAIPMIGLSESWRAAPLFICGLLIILFAGSDFLIRLSRRGEGED